MSLKSTLRSAANRLLAPAGLELVRIGQGTPPPSRWTMTAALTRCAALGVRPGTLIDVGAAEGAWARPAREIFPNSALLLIEPLVERRAALTPLTSTSGTHLETAVAGPTDGEVDFTVADDLDGSGVYGAGALRRLPQVSIDTLVDRHALPPPYLLKLDTHGYEIPIFEGASATLTQTELIMVEAYGFKPSPTAVPFWELCSWLGARGFRPADLADPVGRRRDGLFWQADFLFLRSDHPAFASNTYA